MTGGEGPVTRFYFDWAATAPPLPPLVKVGAPSVQDIGAGEAVPFANPSSAHSEGRAAAAALEDARRRAAVVLGVPSKTLYWTSGGSESNAIPFFSLLLTLKRAATPAGKYNDAAAAAADAAPRPAYKAIDCVTTAIEHPSILKNAETLAGLGLAVKYLRPGADGRIRPETLDKALQFALGLRLVSVQAVNNETGAVHGLPRLVEAARGYAGNAVHFHCDAVQALGKIPLSLEELDSASFSAHKLGGPRGIGLLYLKKPLAPLIKGGGQEGGVRPGTENVAGALAFARCIELFAAPAALRENYAAAQTRMERLIGGLCSIDRCRIVPREREAALAPVPAAAGADAAGAGGAAYSPYILTAAFRGLPGEVMARLLDDAGFAVSTGSACSTGTKKKQTLTAMGLDDITAFETIRISQGFSTTAAEIDALLAAIRDICRKW